MTSPGVLAALLLLSGCAGDGDGTTRLVPPCTAWLILRGASDMTFRCPGPVLEKNTPQPAPKR